MKKAKMFLAAVAIFGIVVAAFAFKARKFGSAVYYTCNKCPACDCTKEVVSIYASLSATESANFPNPITNASLTSSTKECTDNSGCGTIYGSTAP